MGRREIVAGLLGLILLPACGSAAPAATSPSPTTTPSPAPTPQPPRVTFTGSVARTPGATVRFGPGLDMPVMDIEPAGRSDSFDGWIARPDGAWLHLADGRGWVAGAAVQGQPPAGMPQTAWNGPAALPDATAGLLDIAIDLQDQRATCEVAALKMALSGRGILTDERTLLAAAGIDGRAPEVDARGNILRWGDPETAFVGSPDGSPPEHTGYGVYAPPIARAATRAGAQVLASGPGIAPAALYRDVIGGHPAVAWVTNDYRAGSLATWTAWDGAEVRYSLKEHAVLVIGVTPTQVLLDDPWYGQRWHARGEFEAAYGTFGDMAVVIA
ncbi:MAG TPA: C39 family peptidase [Candidatus Dormibacteraeota bacterium]|nr:C39 family peptidase [Candidatus Dormibacteraeota bacterium]